MFVTITAYCMKWCWNCTKIKWTAAGKNRSAIKAKFNGLAKNWDELLYCLKQKGRDAYTALEPICMILDYRVFRFQKVPIQFPTYSM